MKKQFILLCTIFLSAALYSQDTIYITPGNSIQAGINSRNDGDIVIVEDGLYHENINFNGKAITVASRYLIDGLESHITNTIIDGSQPSNPDNGAVVSFLNGEDTTSVLCGFTVTGGKGSAWILEGTKIRMGGGIFALNSGAYIKNNFIQDNSIQHNIEASGGGIGAYAEGANFIIENNIIRNNSINTPTVLYNSLGGGIYLWTTGNVRIIKNEIIGNTITAPVAFAGGVAPYNGNNFLICENLISGNIINASVGGSGGIDVYQTSPFIRNNIISGNSAPNGGGLTIESPSSISKAASAGSGLLRKMSSKLENKFAADKGAPPNFFSGDYHYLNNTIVNNNATISGGGISILGPVPQLMNFIIYGNTAESDSQISGSANVQYSDIQGGYAGTGNLDVSPNFADTVYYYLNISSPCADAGNPDSSFNDIEDHSNLGFALWPALSTLRNDMGAYGGNPYAVIHTELLGPLFKSFVSRVNSIPVSGKQAIIDSFMSASSSFPFIDENSIVYYIYQGNAGSVNVPGDANSWNETASPMIRLDETNFWYCEAIYEPDARLDYKFILNGSTWILDPLNPNQVSGGFGPNSELAMPDYIQPPEIEYRADIPHGTIETFSFPSIVLGNTRTIKVYTPFNYEGRSSTVGYPLMLLHDGLEYLTLGSANNIIDYLIASNKINPIICVFVPPVNRDDEYAFNKTTEFETFIIDELMPHIDSAYRTTDDPHQRAMTGLSFGGLITTQICYNHPESFGLSAPYSPSYWAKNMEVFNSVLNGSKKDITWYLDWGTYESVITILAKALKDGLLNKDYEVQWNEWHEGHSWGSWRAHLDNALEHFFPYSVDVKHQENLPKECLLFQNYPNPFNPSTTIKYSIPNQSKVILKVYDILGNEVAILINEEIPAGNYEVEFNGSNLPSGVYFYKLEAGNFLLVKKMIFLK
ncbi:MAG: alpha/beta hydrolase-fold protein [Ignavibacteria bacterium]